MNFEFTGTKGKWRYVKPTSHFDACTISENGKIIGYAAKNSMEDMANELLRSKSLEMLEMLQYLQLIDCEDFTQDVQDKIEQLLKQATEL